MKGCVNVKMTKEKLNAITTYMKEKVWRNDDLMFAYTSRNEEEVFDMFSKLLDIASSLHNELYNEVKGDYYDYAFHWANKIGACEPEDDLFKNIEEGE